MTIEQMIQRKNELGLTYEQIASLSGIPIGTVQKVLGGITTSPRYDTIMALEKVFAPDDTNNLIMEDSVVYGSNTVKKDDSLNVLSKKPGEFTLDDYYALPEERRVELIDGVFYDMAAPSAFHQLIIGHLYSLFHECMQKHDSPCEVMLSPFDVRLDRDNYTIVQPDLLVICHELDYLHLKRLEGAPDLAVEILSPSTRSKDLFLKLYKYKNAGVREYWIVDPENQTVTVHLLENDEHYEPRKYSFQDLIPVGISGGTCSVGLYGLMERLSRSQ